VTAIYVSLEAYREMAYIPDSDLFHETVIYKRFHRLPSLLHGRVLKANRLAVRAEPSRRVSLLWIDIFQRNREMYCERVEVCPIPEVSEPC
jgi:hypothetical protein